MDYAEVVSIAEGLQTEGIIDKETCKNITEKKETAAADELSNHIVRIVDNDPNQLHSILEQMGRSKKLLKMIIDLTIQEGKSTKCYLVTN